MAVSVDTVYQKVLAIANKEQRGYITPQEFNLFANKAQKELYENYFHNLKMAERKPKNQMDFADEVEMIEEKLQPFYVDTTVATATALLTLPTVHKLINITRGGNEVTELNLREITYTENNPLTAATVTRSTFVREEANQVRIYPAPTGSTNFDISYYKTPANPNWTYIVVNEKALYNASATDAQNFELHPSEEENLVTRILQLAGVVMKQPDIQQAAMVDAQMADREKNN